MLDPNATLYLNGCTMQTTYTGLKLNQGTLVIDNNVLISNAARNEAEAVEFTDDVDIEMMASALLDIDGYVKL